jgi:sulfide:quinone oxidoreductase
MSNHHQVLIIGGGTAGITVAAQLRQLQGAPGVAILEPSERHFYQPIWTLVGGGVFPREISMRDEADFIPPGATWIKDSAASFDPENSTVTTAGGQTLTYDVLVVAAGIQINWGAVEGLAGNVGKGGVCSNYSYDTVGSTWENIRNLKGGRALFTQPGTPIKCGGAPQKIMYLAEHHFRRAGVREKIEVTFASAAGGIFPVTKYAAALNKVLENRGIVTHFEHDLVAIRAAEKVAVFEKVGSGERVEVGYDMIHVTPPQGPPDFLAQSPLGDAGGWIDVDKLTTQHVRYPNVFSLGDCSNLPTSKTGAAIRAQAPVTTANVAAFIAGRPLEAAYNGYTSCPLVTGYGKLILAEFDYDKQPMESFPFDQAQERYSMYALKAYGLPNLYWNGMLRGRM